jgi:hypothetical protein
VPHPGTWKGPVVPHQPRIRPPARHPRRLRRIAAAAVFTLGIVAVSGVAAQAAPGGAVLSLTHGMMRTRTATGGSGVSVLNGELRNASGPATTSATAGDGPLSYNGGVAGSGVVTGAPKVYVVFWGSQWGAEGTTTSGAATYAKFSGDPTGMAPVLQAFYAGLGTNGETWSGISTAYCQSGSAVSVRSGATSCPAGAVHVRYPSGGALGGVWEDTRQAAPAAATESQLAAEALAASAHFGKAGVTTGVQFVIVSPHGTAPDGFNTASGQFCAWHDYTPGPTGAASDTSTVLYTNLPYIPDAGYACGAGYVNSGAQGALDGVSVIASHEYVETVTDPYVGYGWYNTGYGEAADVCAWLPTDQNGAVNLDTGRGTFAVSGVWDNQANGGAGGCIVGHAVIADHTISIANPGAQSGTLATPVRPLAVRATDANSSTTGGVGPSVTPSLRYQATGLPSGLKIDPATGVISGTPHAAIPAHVTVTVSDGLGGYGVIHFLWTVRNPIVVTHPAAVTTSAGTAITIRLHAHDLRGHRVTYGATGLPGGLSIGTRSGVISGRVSGHRGSYIVTIRVTGLGGLTAGTRFRVTVR